MMPLPDALECTDADDGLLTIDTAVRQALLEYPDDDDYKWHHVLLLERVGAGKWLMANPYGAVFQKDITGRMVIPLERNALLPDDDRPFLIFDSEVSEAEIAVLMVRATALKD